jgi:hypothetical protein
MERPQDHLHDCTVVVIDPLAKEQICLHAALMMAL